MWTIGSLERLSEDKNSEPRQELDWKRGSDLLHERKGVKVCHSSKELLWWPAKTKKEQCTNCRPAATFLQAYNTYNNIPTHSLQQRLHKRAQTYGRQHWQNEKGVVAEHSSHRKGKIRCMRETLNMAAQHAVSYTVVNALLREIVLQPRLPRHVPVTGTPLCVCTMGSAEHLFTKNN